MRLNFIQKPAKGGRDHWQRSKYRCQIYWQLPGPSAQLSPRVSTAAKHSQLPLPGSEEGRASLASERAIRSKGHQDRDPSLAWEDTQHVLSRHLSPGTVRRPTHGEWMVRGTQRRKKEQRLCPFPPGKMCSGLRDTPASTGIVRPVSAGTMLLYVSRWLCTQGEERVGA